MPYADPEMQRERNRVAARERMRRLRADPEGRKAHNSAERERYWRRKNERARAERDTIVDPVCTAIRDGYILERDRQMNMSADRAEYVAWARKKIELHDGAPLVLSPAQVWRALRRAGLDRLAGSWAARIDLSARRWWLVPVSGRMRECTAEGHPQSFRADTRRECPELGGSQSLPR